MILEHIVSGQADCVFSTGAHRGSEGWGGETGDQAALEIPFPRQACLVLDTQGPTEAHIKGAAAVLIIVPPAVFLYVSVSSCLSSSSPHIPSHLHMCLL